MESRRIIHKGAKLIPKNGVGLNSSVDSCYETLTR